MALSRSASGPGGLSINTSSANMFGSTSSQPPAPGGLFGPATTPKAGGGLFGNTSSSNTTTAAASSSSQPQQTPSLSLFGAASTTGMSQPQSTAASQPQPTTGGLFGTSAPTSQPQQPTGGGLFGGAGIATPSQPQQSGGLFGSTLQNQSQPQGQTQNTGGLFGQAATGTTGGGLFGNASNTSQPANTTAGNSFLGQQSQQKPGLFGGLGQQTQSQTNPLGQSQQPLAIGLGGSLGIGLTMGQSTSAQTVPGVRIDYNNIKGTTRFNDLQEDIQKSIEQIDRFIQEQVSHEREIEGMMPGHGDMLESIPNDVKFVARKYDGARSALESAAQAIDSARVLVNQDADHARLCFRAIDNLKLPQQYHTSGFWSPRQQAAGTANTETDGQDLVGFFSKTADDMADQMKKYEGNLTDIETHMHAVNDSLGDQLQRIMAIRNGTISATDEKIQELVAVLRDFEQGILKVAGDVGSAREGMTRLQLGEFMGSDGYRTGV
ncbi:hypothetical protein F5X96DRAFT_660830 [Biscogniauxia mediterranea]|nr:hypothetical protein F5X96DRAFT_660830 [Biscogniauxia mediterranea]